MRPETGTEHHYHGLGELRLDPRPAWGVTIRGPGASEERHAASPFRRGPNGPGRWGRPNFAFTAFSEVQHSPSRYLEH